MRRTAEDEAFNEKLYKAQHRRPRNDKELELQLKRAKEVEKFGANELAEKIRRCKWRSLCRQRLCPRCAGIRAKKLERHLIKRLRAIKHPGIALLRVESRNIEDFPEDLGDTIVIAKRSLERLRVAFKNKKLFKQGFGVLERKLIVDRHKNKFWLIHWHLVVDRGSLPEYSMINEFWQEILRLHGGGRKGGVSERFGERVNDMEDIASYYTKQLHDTGKEAIRYKEEIEAMKYKRIYKEWGFKAIDKAVEAAKEAKNKFEPPEGFYCETDFVPNKRLLNVMRKHK